MIPQAISGGMRDFFGGAGLEEDIGAGMYDRPQAPVSPQEAAGVTGSFGPSIGGMPGSIGGGRELEAPPDGPDGSNGIGLMGTLGIINAGAGLGGQIFKMISASSQKPKKRYRAVGGPSGGYF